MSGDSRQPARKRSSARLVVWLAAISLAVVAVTHGFQPDLDAAHDAACRAGDEANLNRIHVWIEVARQKRLVPSEGGHRLLLELWTRRLVEATPENLETLFVPGRRERDPHYLDLRDRLQRGESIWTDLAQTTSLDTHYAALATPFLAHLYDADQPIVADDEEDGWSFAGEPHQIHVLYGDGSVRMLELSAPPIFGPDSPTPELRQLAR